jgi:translation elongation factor EF-Tu-like GTPase
MQAKTRLRGKDNPELPFRLTVYSVSNLVGRDGALVIGHIEQGAVHVGDRLQLVSTATSQTKPRRVQCVGVRNVDRQNQAGPPSVLVGVLISGIKQEDVNTGDVLQADSEQHART